jgi:hypothetical protein
MGTWVTKGREVSQVSFRHCHGAGQGQSQIEDEAKERQDLQPCSVKGQLSP